jgi:acyl carrier protein
MSTLMAEEEFCEYLRVKLDIVDRVLPSNDLVEDLNFDSVQLFEAVIWIEELGVAIPDEALDGLRTVADAYRHYSNAFTSGSSQPQSK